MENKNVPYLCVGVLFVLMKQAALRQLSSNKLIIERHSNPKMLVDLIKALRLEENIEDEKAYKDDAFETLVSRYVNCTSNADRKLPFANGAFASSYDDLVKSQYSMAIEKMQKFIQAHLDLGLCKWLVEAILYVIDKDSEIKDTDQFFISPDGVPKSKAEIMHMDQFCLPAVLVGVMHYILMNRGNNNKGGEKTLKQWGTKDVDHMQREYHISSHVRFDRKIEVIFEFPQLPAELPAQESETIEGKPTDEEPTNQECTSGEIYDRIVLLESKIMEHFQCVSNAESVPVQPTDGFTEPTESAGTINQLNTTPEQDQELKLYEYFKADIKDTLAYMIQHDPSGEPIERSLPCSIADFSVQWNKLLYKFEDGVMRENIIQTMELFDKYGYYLSDEFTRLSEDHDFIIFRNQTVEEGNKLREILQPQMTELRYALRDQYWKLYPIQKSEEDSDDTVDNVH